MLIGRKTLRRIISEELNRALPSCRVSDIHIGEFPVQVEIADTPFLRNRGLMNRDYLPRDHGMLFSFPKEGTQSFWMKNTLLPLSIAFIDRDGVIINIERMMPHDLDSVSSSCEVPYALEMNDGWFDNMGINPGSRVTNLPKISIS
jgi:uncharacterized membrane protein (UPF0127 family)